MGKEEKDEVVERSVEDEEGDIEGEDGEEDEGEEEDEDEQGASRDDDDDSAENSTYKMVLKFRDDTDNVIEFEVNMKIDLEEFDKGRTSLEASNAC